MAEAKIGALMVDIQGTALSNADRTLLAHECVGGVILFTRNYQDVEQLEALTSEIKKLKPELLIAVDHEGGRVQRFREGFTRIPPMAALGNLYEREPAEGLALARETGWLLASELRAVGIDFSFTPVLDRDHGVSEVIGDRAFSACPDAIIALSRALIAGMNEAGMPATGKHFPGHGGVAADSHHELPVDTRSFAQIAEQDLLIFKALAESGMQAVMPAHVVYSQVDQQPAGFSRFWLQDVLRTQLAFDGVIFSDDLAMAGAKVAGSYPERALAAFDAGCDMALLCNDHDGAMELAGFLDARSQPSSARLAKMKTETPYKHLSELQHDKRWLAAHETIRNITCNSAV